MPLDDAQLQTIRAQIEASRMAMTGAVDGLTAALAALAPPVRTVHVGEDLQDAINTTGSTPIALDAGGVYPGSYTLGKPNLTLIGNGARIAGVAGKPALYVPPAIHNLKVQQLDVSAAFTVAVQLGRGDTGQSRLEDVPSNIVFDRVRVPSHRGKRAFEISSSATSLLNCEVLDTWDPGGQDSQAVYVANTPGGLVIDGGRFQGGSNCLLIGGDTVKIAGMQPTGFLVQGAEFSRPLSWMTDGVNRKVKNLIELKTGVDAVFRNLALSGNWKQAQVGFAILLTPASGGRIANVLFEDVDVRQTASGIQITGRNDDSITPQRTRGIVFRRCAFWVDKTLYDNLSTTGRLLQVTQEAEDVTIVDSLYTGNIGSAVVLGDYGLVMDPATGLKRKADGLDAFTLQGNRLACGKYAISMAGPSGLLHYGSGLSAFCKTWDVSGNTFGGAPTTLKSYCPNNTYLARDEFDALVATGSIPTPQAMKALRAAAQRKSRKR